MTRTDTRTLPGRAAARAVVLLLAAWGIGLAGAQDLQVIELRHRLADELIPVLQPLLEPGAALTGMDSMLFVRTSPDNFEQLRAAVALLDRKPRQLLVTVGQGTVERDSGQSLRGTATIGDGDVQVGVNRPPADDPGVSVAIAQGSQRADLHDVSTVRMLEGSETYIAIGRSAPVTTTQVIPGRGGPAVVQSTDYREASTGFYATARVNGDLVTLELSPRQQRWRNASADGRIDTAAVTTQVSGRLGEWMPIGGAEETSQRTDDGLLSHGRQREARRYSAWVKVEEVP